MNDKHSLFNQSKVTFYNKSRATGTSFMSSPRKNESTFVKLKNEVLSLIKSGSPTRLKDGERYN